MRFSHSLKRDTRGFTIVRCAAERTKKNELEQCFQDRDERRDIEDALCLTEEQNGYSNTAS